MTPRQLPRLLVLTVISVIVLLFCFYLSLRIGAFRFSTSEILHYIVTKDQTEKSLIFHDVRLPRALMTMIIGANLAVSGALMQAVTRNPLASPSVLGLNAGASLIVVFTTVMLPGVTGFALAGSGFVGGLLAAALIFFMSVVFKGGDQAVKIALVGIAIQALLSSGTQAILLFNEESTQQILVWLAGTVAGTTWDDIEVMLPFTFIGLIASFLAARRVSVLALGDETSVGLGVSIFTTRILLIAIVIMLAGASVSVVGPIGFVGLIVPHIARYLVGNDYRIVLPYCVLIGAILLTVADISSRFVSFPSETPVGILTALIGTPYFIYLARSYKRRKV
ncbi:FecCD family ABC transporter permease [Terribacillus saccharophilus]|uniref:FecCD family ABC transporter permease n=1 Tax=Terribacillus saccharophilus TaxID=361277 RepID=UPI00298A0188|nr:iron ABC transporter permease [Terribacillus saccharophilus]MCM3227317.1 iron ABC transporter permease [Terribacillus saccharophilus]